MTDLFLGDAPAACTLPTVERPLRVAEFGRLFAGGLRAQTRVSATRLRWVLDPAAEAEARDLTARESQCCSFFVFDVTSGGRRRRGRGGRRRPGGAGGRPGRLGVVGGAGEGHGGDPVTDGAGGAALRGGPEPGMLRSGQVADAAGVNVETLRYYERRGLLPQPDRSPGGHRLYPTDAVTVLRVVKAAQRLGFSLDEVAELLAVGHPGHPTPGRPRGRTAGTGRGGLQDRAAAKLAEVETRIADLQVIAETLRAALNARCDDLMACAANDSCCPIPFSAIASIPVGAPVADRP